MATAVPIGEGAASRNSRDVVGAMVQTSRALGVVASHWACSRPTPRARQRGCTYHSSVCTSVRGGAAVCCPLLFFGARMCRRSHVGGRWVCAGVLGVVGGGSDRSTKQSSSTTAARRERDTLGSADQDSPLDGGGDGWQCGCLALGSQRVARGCLFLFCSSARRFSRYRRIDGQTGMGMGMGMCVLYVGTTTASDGVAQLRPMGSGYTCLHMEQSRAGQSRAEYSRFTTRARRAGASSVAPLWRPRRPPAAQRRQTSGCAPSRCSLLLPSCPNRRPTLSCSPALLALLSTTPRYRAVVVPSRPPARQPASSSSSRVFVVVVVVVFASTTRLQVTALPACLPCACLP
ncbi:hypothetical protein T440DRAFT_544084 [Plenodomus tracheiphilus IPT5]|uniref:Uncharacterized protein n=1 Tax=Plenodomus tracheiphilus IPT5 TaxID=1408161 RepID=A0A6A7AQ92_9PLEO|nr:hypothetical protein T440DRAFT_544084 [Plenodomus tracheiphilus IPT5]